MPDDFDTRLSELERRLERVAILLRDITFNQDRTLRAMVAMDSGQERIVHHLQSKQGHHQ